MVKSSLTEEQLKRAQEIYQIARGKSLTDRKAYLQSLTEQERDFYKKEDNKMRQKKFNTNPENKDKYNDIRKTYIETSRQENPELFSERNVRDVKAFREREKAKLLQIQTKLKANQTLTDAIKNRKARKELELLKKEKVLKQQEKNEPIKKTRGRPRKPRNPVGRPKGAKNKVKETKPTTPRPKKS